MKKTFAILFVTAAMLGGCATHSTSPAARAAAVQHYASGASCDEIASKMMINRDYARELIRVGILDLNQKLYKTR
jgi:uncharacterized protein YceK